MNFDYEFSSPLREKIAKIYRNGDPTIPPFELKIQEGQTLQSIQHQLEIKSEMKNMRHLRLFNEEGVELTNEDLKYLNDKTVLYASRGEDFDANSTFSEYNLIRVLGEGGFGQVILGVHKKTFEKVAIKIVKTNVISNAQDIDMVFREAAILKSLNHNNIVKIMNCYTLSDMKVVFIMEYLEGGELLQRIESEKNKRFTEDQAKIYFRQIVDAINYCHKNRLIHRDLKLENILLKSHDNNIVKIVDFGIAGIASKFNVENIDAGSLKYMAPEVLQGKIKQLMSSIDIWALGVILYLMIFGEFPFEGNTHHQIMEKIQEGTYQMPKDIKKTLSKECIDCIEKMLQVDPAKRITTSDLSNHAFISGGDLAEKMCEQNQETFEEQKDQNQQKNQSKIFHSGNNLIKKDNNANSVQNSCKNKPISNKSQISSNPKGSFTPQANKNQTQNIKTEQKTGFGQAVSKFGRK